MPRQEQVRLLPDASFGSWWGWVRVRAAWQSNGLPLTPKSGTAGRGQSDQQNRSPVQIYI